MRGRKDPGVVETIKLGMNDICEILPWIGRTHFSDRSFISAVVEEVHRRRSSKGRISGKEASIPRNLKGTYKSAPRKCTHNYVGSLFISLFFGSSPLVKNYIYGINFKCKDHI